MTHNIATKTAKLLLSLSVSTFSLAAPAFAQDTASQPEQASDSSSQDIVVTAQFRSQKLQDTPIAITAVTGATLEARSQTNLADVAAQAPSVVLKPGPAAGGPSISATIRGMGQIDFNPAYEPGVGIYIDDVYYPRLTGANFDLMDVERVEILRGPQGTLTGRNSEGGAIKFVSRRPDGNGGGYLSATYGSRNRINVRGSADFTLAQNLYARISGTFADQKGYVSQIDYGCAKPGSGVTSTRPAGDCTIAKFGDVGYRAVRGIVRYNPSNAFDLMLTADYLRDDRNSAPEVLLYGLSANPNVVAGAGIPLDSRFICGRFCNYASNSQPASPFIAGLIPPLNGLPQNASTVDHKSVYDGYGFAGNLVVRPADNVEITSITAYRAFKSSFSDDLDLTPASGQSGRNKLDDNFFSQELRVNVKASDWADFTVGGYYSHETALNFTQQDIRYVGVGALPLFPLQFVGNDPVKVTSKAAFATVIVHPAPALTITGGVRYTKESKEYTFYRYNFDGRTINAFLDPVGAACGIGFNGPDTNDCNGNGNRTEVLKALSGTVGRFKGNRFDYRLSADYRFSPEVLAYATVSTGFKGGGISPRPFNAAQVVPFGAETLTAYEIGVKTDLFDRKVRLNVSAYLNKFKGAQLTLLDCPQFGGPGPCAVPQNAGNADVKGIEAELTIRPFAGFQIDMSGSLLDWKWTCVNPAVVGATGTSSCDSSPALVNQLVKPPRGVGEKQWSIGAEYEANLGSAGTLTPRFDISYQDALPGGNTYPAAGSPSALYGTSPSYTLANGRLTWRNANKDVDVSLEVTNLFNKYYYLNIFDLFGGAGTITGVVGRPREWAVSIKKKF